MPKAEIKNFIARNFLFSEDGDAVPDDDSLMKNGTLDSTGILELIMFVEEKFKLKIPDEDMLPQNFDSVRAITEYIEARRRQAA